MRNTTLGRRRLVTIAVCLLVTAASAVVAGDTMAQAPLDTCEKQQSEAADAVVVTRAGGRPAGPAPAGR